MKRRSYYKIITHLFVTFAILQIIMWIMGAGSYTYAGWLEWILHPVEHGSYMMYIFMALSFLFAYLYTRTVFSEKRSVILKIISSLILFALFATSYNSDFSDIAPTIITIIGISIFIGYMFFANFLGKGIKSIVDSKKADEEQINLDEAYKSTKWADDNELDRL